VNGTSGLMTGGDDGLASIADTDFIGSEAGGTGLYALDAVEDLSIFAVPGRATSAAHNSMITYAEVHREGSCFAVFDPPEDMSATEIVTYVETTASLLGASEFAAIYWPRVKVSNPNKSVFGNDAQIVVPPSGSIMGVMSRSDATGDGGVYKAPAGIERGQMRSILGFETDEVLNVRKRGIVFPKRINPLTTGTGKPRFIDGARTLKSNGNFPYVNERRGVIFIGQSVKRGLDFARHQNNDDSLRATCFRTVRLFLIGEMRKKAFRSMDPKKAFVVDFGKGLNPDSAIFAGELRGKVGLATQKPAEFVFVTFSQDTRALEAEAES
jgi:phage tail sheath protein FI